MQIFILAIWRHEFEWLLKGISFTTSHVGTITDQWALYSWSRPIALLNFCLKFAKLGNSVHMWSQGKCSLCYSPSGCSRLSWNGSWRGHVNAANSHLSVICAFASALLADPELHMILFGESGIFIRFLSSLTRLHWIQLWLLSVSLTSK